MADLRTAGPGPWPLDNSGNISLDIPNTTYVHGQQVYGQQHTVSLEWSRLSGLFNVVVLLAVVLPVIAANTVLLAALVLESPTVKVVCLVLGSILVSCLLAALGLTMYHIAGINLSPADKPPEVPYHHSIPKPLWRDSNTPCTGRRQIFTTCANRLYTG